MDKRILIAFFLLGLVVQAGAFIGTTQNPLNYVFISPPPDMNAETIGVDDLFAGNIYADEMTVSNFVRVTDTNIIGDLNVFGSAWISGDLNVDGTLYGADVNGYVPYVGASQDVDLGSQDLSTGGEIKAGFGGNFPATIGDETTGAAFVGTSVINQTVRLADAGTPRAGYFSDNTYAITLLDISGNNTIGGNATIFPGTVRYDGGLIDNTVDLNFNLFAVNIVTLNSYGLKFPTNKKAIFGTGSESEVYFNDNLVLDPKAVGSGIVHIPADLNVDEDLNVGGTIYGDANGYTKTVDLNTQFVPYIGATKDVNLGSYDFNTAGKVTFKALTLTNATNTIAFPNNGVIRTPAVQNAIQFADGVGNIMRILNFSGGWTDGAKSSFFQMGQTNAFFTASGGSILSRMGISTTGMIVSNTSYATLEIPTERFVVKGNIHLYTDNDKILLGAAKNASMYFNGNNFVINPKEVGSGIVSIPGDLNVDEDLNVGGSIYVDGNVFGNVPLAASWNDTLAGQPLNFTVANVWYWFDLSQNTRLNGFHVSDQNIVAEYPGLYRIQYNATGSGQNNHNYITTVAVNDVNNDNCIARKTIAAGGDITPMNQPGCYLDLAEEDVIRLLVMDWGGTGAGTVYHYNIIIERVGN